MEIESIVLIDGTKFKKGEFRLNKEIIRIVQLNSDTFQIELKGTTRCFYIPYRSVLYYLEAE